MIHNSHATLKETWCWWKKCEMHKCKCCSIQIRFNLFFYKYKKKLLKVFPTGINYREKKTSIVLTFSHKHLCISLSWWNKDKGHKTPDWHVPHTGPPYAHSCSPTAHSALTAGSSSRKLGYHLKSYTQIHRIICIK